MEGVHRSKRVCIRACVHVCMCACVQVDMCACVHVCKWICVHVCMRASGYVCSCRQVHLHSLATSAEVCVEMGLVAAGTYWYMVFTQLFAHVCIYVIMCLVAECRYKYRQATCWKVCIMWTSVIVTYKLYHNIRKYWRSLNLVICARSGCNLILAEI